jgi:hypothetical protein
MSSLKGWNRPVQVITSIGRGKRRRERPDRFGFPKQPRAIMMRHKAAFGFMTGDFVKGTSTRRNHFAVHVGRVTVRESGQFYIKKPGGAIGYFSHNNTRRLQRGDGYRYSRKAPPNSRKGAAG